MSLEKFHTDFKLNGVSFSSVEELLNYTSGFSEEIYDFLKNWFSKEDYILVNTSGSTGKPKEIKILKKQMINSAFATGSYFKLLENTTSLLCLSVNYIAGKMMLVRALVLGWKLDVTNINSNPLKGVKKKFDFVAMVPLQLENSLEKLNQIKNLIVGGGVVSNKLQSKISNTNCNVFATYGMTETVTHIAIKKLNNTTNKFNFYETLPNVEIYKDHRNCLVIDAFKVSNKVLFTNDIVELYSDKQFKWIGRFDNIINSGTIKLYPELIEEKLSLIINSRFFVTGVSDEKLGQKLVLIIEGKKQKIDFSKSKLSKFEIPKNIYFIEKFIETETNKIHRIKTLNSILAFL
ncbi:AMP-binding protein [Polaribacter sp. Z022]|uniref:AMP-binding protein n=1 Tax=Polaribacter sp. Z022 TaxID=2927125 RepID=UPI0020204021|nr:AMP-binding protein [Polaribacter sp. Z022]MCL7752952.1 AMP-binding protein [Polaribacter sp. Z022]